MPFELPGYELLTDGVYSKEYTTPARGSVIRRKRIILLSKYDYASPDMIADFLQDAALEASTKKISDESSVEGLILQSHPSTRVLLQTGGTPVADLVSSTLTDLILDAPHFLYIHYGIVPANDLETAQRQGFVTGEDWYHALFSTPHNEWRIWEMQLPSRDFTEAFVKDFKKQLRRTSVRLKELGDTLQPSFDLLDRVYATVTVGGVSELHDRTGEAINSVAKLFLRARYGKVESEVGTAQKEQLDLQRAFTAGSVNHGKDLYPSKPS